jgi:C-terminal processing protease CtpA/Prc
VRPAEKPLFAGRIAVLMDEYDQSALEGLAQMLGSFCGAKLIGGITTGANGNSTNFVLPGGIQINITGTDMKYRTAMGEVQQQRVGVKPDIGVAPTIAGVRAGRDVVLERAIEFARSGR